MRVATVCGTRPELIKLAPLVPELSARFDHHYLFTGQHYSPNMVQVFVDELDAPAPDSFLDVGTSEIDALTAATAAKMRELRPDVVVTYGDTNSTLAGSRAAKEVGAILIHVEAGIRSFDRSMPEELNRVIVDEISDLRLAPTGLAAWFLTAFEHRPPPACPVVGNLAVDAWVRHRDLIAARPGPGLEGDYAVMTLHRQATVDDPEVLGRALKEFGSLSMPILFPVHPRTADRMKSFGLEWPDNLQICEPIGYLDFCRAMSGAAILLTDSGGVQEEGISLGIPCITLRPNTERMETVFLGGNKLFDLARDTGLAGDVEHMLATHGDRPYQLNPFGSGYAAARIAAVIELLDGRAPTASFPDEAGFATMADLQAAASFVAASRRAA
ncbi:MAG: UDP-N-acetylglucosamine 2-epimerase (non-hydrolyzing) [Proteobacteria bacterium]|nr:UDP-N-acetylglucosamine 2-epimerase (non-hydrolyzing) [Pseudomonadota bacterium]